MSEGVAKHVTGYNAGVGGQVGNENGFAAVAAPADIPGRGSAAFYFHGPDGGGVV